MVSTLRSLAFLLLFVALAHSAAVPSDLAAKLDAVLHKYADDATVPGVSFEVIDKSGESPWLLGSVHDLTDS